MSLAMAFAVGCVTPIATLFPPPAGEPTMSVYVISHGWHTGIVMAREDVSSEIWPEQNDFRDFRYVEVGWGDRAFYQAPQPTAWLAFTAAFGSGESVLHVVGFDAPVVESFPGAEIVAIELSRRGFEELARFIHRAYVRDEAGTPIRLGRGQDANSRFYLARGRYHVFNTCNTWTAAALRSAGSPITPAYAITAGNVISQASRFGRVIRSGP